jgi:hypothetical protein
MALDKYKKFMKEKVISGATETKTGSYEGKKKLSYFNPNSQLLGGAKEVVVRVLPNKNGLFFQQFKKHSFKIGTRKNAVCMYSIDSNGEPVGKECPFCDFLEENKDSLDRETQYQLSAKDAYLILVYDELADEIKKLEVNDYGITDILTALQNLEDLDPDIDGFNIHFRKDERGYAKVFKASPPTNTLNELLTISRNVKSIPDIFKEAIPAPNQFIMDSIRSLFDLAIHAFAPTFANSGQECNSAVEDDAPTSVSNYDPNADEFEEHETNEEVVLPEDPEEDSGVDDIKKFLDERKKKQ